MNKYVADTMALVLRLEKRKMPGKAKEIFVLAEKGKAEIIIPAMVLAEIGYLSEGKKIETNLEKAKKYLDRNPNINEAAMTFKTVNIAFEIDDIPELHDRLIAAIGKQLNIEVITNDPEIEDSRHVNTIWKR